MKRYFFVFFFLFPLLAISQTLPSYINAKAPEVSAFEKHIETPVSMYTGVPSISIPLYDIEIKGVKIPIVLNYHAGGIRVDQEATWVGLGWDLSYGGQISRTVRGLPDERYFIIGGTQSNALSNINYFRQYPNITADPTLSLRYDAMRQAKYRANDYMPDAFYYSALGYSGKFMFSQEQNKFILFPREDIAIKYFGAPNISAVNFYKWNLKLPEGTSVDFGQDANSSSYTDQNVTEPVTLNSWLVKTVRNVNNDSVTYNYESFLYDTYKISGQSSTITTPSHLQTFNTNVTRFYYNDRRPTSINFPNGTINFITTDRSDMPTKALSEIDVLNNNGGIIKRIVFRYSYFNGSNYDMASIIGNWQNYVSDSYRYTRLRLDGIDIIGSDGTSTKSYNFDYYTSTIMPSKWSFAQDHWGFYNGKINTTQYSFIPNFYTNNYAPFTGGDRGVDPNYSNLFSLKSVIYPEGGKTEYIYENNTTGLNGIPSNFLNTFQDNNLLDKSATISINGSGRMSANQTPDHTTSGVRYFYQYFTASDPNFLSPGYSWLCSTNFGISSLEQSMTPAMNNAKFMLEQLVGGVWTEVREFNSHPTNNTFNGSNNDIIRFKSAGSYRLTIALTYTGTQGSAAENQPYNLSFTVKWREINPATKMVYAGGLRVKDINYRRANGNIVKKKHYDYINPYADATIPTYTSGRVVSFPYYYQLKTNIINFAGGGDYWFETLSAQSSQPLETTSGSYCGYEYVNEIDVDSTNAANNLKAVNHFSFNPPYFSQYYPMMHLGAWEPEEWTRGKLLSTQYYKGNSIIKKEDYSYYDWSPHLVNQTNEDYVQEINTDLISNQYLQRICSCTVSNFPVDFIDTDQLLNTLGQGAYNTGWYYGVDFYHQTSPPPPNPPYAWDHVELPYFLHYTGFDKPKSKTITSYDGGHAVVQAENYFYEKTPSLYQQTKTQTFSSMKDTLETRVKYSLDSAAVNVYNHMLMRHILNRTIVQSQYKNSIFLQSSNTNYKQWADTAILAPVRDIVQIGSNGAYVKNVYNAYDSKGNVLSASKSLGANVSYLWGYNNQYPIAAVGNAHSNDIFFEGFEENLGNTVLGDSKTGRYSHTGGYSKTLTGLDNGSYLLTYWQGAGSVWTLVSTPVTVSTGAYTINLSTQVDDIRFYPANAMMTTYTYDPLIGITSITDQKNESTYYEYDGLQRLLDIKDKDRNIIKSFCYNYAINASGCLLNLPSIPNARKDIVFTKSCSAGYVGSQVTYYSSIREIRIQYFTTGCRHTGNK